MVRERTCEILLFDELAAFVICVLIWREAYKGFDLVKKTIWKPQSCTIENNPPDMRNPEPQLMPEETDSDFEIIDEEYIVQKALIEFVYNNKGEEETAAGGNPTLDAEDCTSKVSSRITAFYIRVAGYLAKVYSIVSPGNMVPEVRLTNVLKLLLADIISDNSTLHVKFDVPQSSDPTNEVEETNTNAENHSLNEDERIEALKFAKRVFDFINHKLTLDRKICKEVANAIQEYDCKITCKFVSHMLSTFKKAASSELNFEVDTALLLFERLVTHLVEIFALVRPGDTTPETKCKIIKKALFRKATFDDKKFAKSKLVLRYFNTDSGDNTTGDENTAIILKRIFENLCINDGIRNPKPGEATVVETVETKRVIGNSTNESEDTTIREDTTLTAHEEEEVISFIEKIFNYLAILLDQKNPIAVGAAADTENSTPEAPVTCIEEFIVDMVYFLNRDCSP